MKRTYADLHLCIDLNDVERASRAFAKVSRLGYSLVGLPFSPKLHETVITKIDKMCDDAGLEFASRIDLRPRNTEELLTGLRKFRRRYEVVAVLCESKQVARQAAKDRRVDVLNFPQPDFRRRFFDAAEAELASNGVVSLEIDIRPLLSAEGVVRARLLSNLRKETSIATDFGVGIIVSSGVSDEILMRKPVEMAALASLFDLRNDFALDAVSNNPLAIVKRNRKKLESGFVAPGIRVLKRGRDC